MADQNDSASELVSLKISTSNNSPFFNEKRFSKNILVSELKEKLELITGGNSESMQIEVYDPDSKLVCCLDEDNVPIGSYALENGMRLYIIDTFRIKDIVDRAENPRRVMTPDVYAKRQHTVMSYLKTNKLGQYSEEYAKKKEQDCKDEKTHFDSIRVGARCLVNIPTKTLKTGTILYKGPVEGLDGYRLGIKYDVPLGKHDGYYKGKRYFECPPMRGSFVRARFVELGNFPEEEEDSEENQI